MKMPGEGSGGGVRARSERRAHRDRGLLGERRLGRPCLSWAVSPTTSLWPPLRLARLGREPESVLVVCPPVSRRDYCERRETALRFIGLDVHLDFCEIAICEAGRVRSGGRVPTSPQGLAILANSLGPDDHVALEATGNALAIARALEAHVARVVVATRTELRAITEAKVKTDRRDAGTLARLLAAGLLRGCCLPDEPTRALRRRLARRAQLVRQRTRAKNEVHAVLMRTVKGRPPVTDAFGKRGRAWLAALELPADERETVDGCVRQIAFLDGEIAILERAIAEHALASTTMQRLMTVPRREPDDRGDVHRR